MAELWYIADGDRVDGPFDRASFSAEVRVRALAPSTLVWRSGLAAWTPLGGLKAEDRPDLPPPEFVTSREPLSGAVDPAPPPLDKPTRRMASWGLLLSIVGLLALATALLVMAYVGIGYTTFGVYAGTAHLLSWSLAIAVSIIATTLAWRSTPRSPSALRMLSALVCVAAMVLALPLSQVSELVGRLGKARASFDGYELRYDPTKRVIKFSGPIGPGLAARLRELLYVNAGVAAVEVTSNGGLIDEAILAGKVFEAHGDLTVRVRGECSSACIALVMGANTRVADVGSRFGFHQTASVTSMPDWALRALPEPDGGLRTYVVSRGFPAADFDRFTASQKMQMVPAIRMRQMGLLQTLDRAGQPVSDEEAAWFWLASLLPENSGVRDLAESMALSGNPKLISPAAKFLDVLEKGNVDQARIYMAQITPVAISESVLSAEPVAFKNYARASVETVGYLVRYEKWRECAGAVSGNGIAPSAQLPSNLIDAETRALATLVRSATAAKWQQRTLPSWAKQQYERLIDAATKDMVTMGLFNAPSGDPRVMCLATYIVLDRVASLNPDDGAVMYAMMAQSQ